MCAQGSSHQEINQGFSRVDFMFILYIRLLWVLSIYPSADNPWSLCKSHVRNVCFTLVYESAEYFTKKIESVIFNYTYLLENLAVLAHSYSGSVVSFTVCYDIGMVLIDLSADCVACSWENSMADKAVLELQWQHIVLLFLQYNIICND